MYGTRNKKPVLSDNLEGWNREGGGGGRFNRKGPYAYLMLIHVDVWPKKPPYSCKVIIL